MPDRPATSEASVDGSALALKGGSLVVSATNGDSDTEPRIIAVTGSLGVGGQQSGIGIAGMVSVNVIKDETNADITDSTVAGNLSGPLVAGPSSVSVTTGDSSRLIAVGGAVGVGKSVGIGAAFGYNEIGNGLHASIDGSSVKSIGNLTVSSDSTSQIYGAVLGVGFGSGGIGGAGSALVNQIGDTIDAHITDSPDVSSESGAIALSAKDDSFDLSVAGGVAGAGTGAVGAAVTYNLIQDTIESSIDNSTVNAKAGPLTTTATSSPELVAVAVGGAGADALAIGGSVTVNSVANTVDSHIGDNSDIRAAGDIDLTGTEGASMYDVAGGLGIAPGGIAVGAAFAYNYMGGSFDPLNPNVLSKDTSATTAVNVYIDGSTVHAGGNLTVGTGITPPSAPSSNIDAHEEDFNASAVDFSAAPSNGTITFAGLHGFVTGDAVVYHKDDSDTAVGTHETTDKDGKTTVDAALLDGHTYYAIRVSDTQIKLASTPDRAASGDAIPFVAAGTGTQTLTRYQVDLPSSESGLKAFDPATAVHTSSDSSEPNTIDFGSFDPHGLATGQAVTYHSGSGTNTAVGGLTDGATYYVIKVSETAIRLAATPDDATSGLAIPLTSAGTGAGHSLTWVASGGGSVTPITLPVGQTSQLLAVTVAAAVGDLAAISGAASVNFLRNSDVARINGANGAHSVTAGGTLTVTTNDDSTLNADSGGVALGLGSDGASVSVGVSAAYNDIRNSLTSEINDSTVSAPAVSVTANSRATIQTITIGGAAAVAGGDVGIGVAGAGAGSGNVIRNTVKAAVTGSTVTASRAQGLTVSARDTSTITADAGGLAIAVAGGEAGAAISIGLSAAYNDIENTVEALISGATVTAPAVAVTATSNANVSALTIAGAASAPGGEGGGIAGAGAAAGSDNTVKNTVSAVVKTSTVQPPSAQSVSLTVKSEDDSSVTADAGGAAFGLAGGEGGGAAAALGGALAFNDIENTITASLDGSQLLSGSGLTVQAVSDATIDALTFGLAGAIAGGAGFGGAFAGAGSGSGNTIANLIQAFITGGSQVFVTGPVVLTATDGAAINAVAGAAALSFALSSAAVAVSVGVSAAINKIHDETDAEVTGGSSVTAGGTVTIAAKSGATVNANTYAGSVAAAVGGGTSVAFGGAGAFSSNTIGDTIQALANGGSQVTTSDARGVSITARDESSVTANAGGIALTGSDLAAISVGAAAATSDIGNTIRSSVDGATVTVTHAADPTATQTFDGSAVNAATDTIAFPSPHGFGTGDPVVYHANGTSIGGLDDGRTYFVIPVDSTHVKLAATPEDAAAGRAIDLVTRATFDAPSAVDKSADTITLPNPFAFIPGEAVRYHANGGSAIGGLTDGATYYVN